MHKIIMKRSLLLGLFLLSINLSQGQEWFTSFDVAKRMARVQNKMLFVLWEDSFSDTLPLFTVTDNGKVNVVDLSRNTSLDSLIWDYFIPVKLPESEFEKFNKEAKNRGLIYGDKLMDDSVKIMDPNGVIINIGDMSDNTMNLSLLIGRYALNTSYLNAELENYASDPSFLNTMMLAIRYVDFAIYGDNTLKPEILEVAEIYLEESEGFLSEMKESDIIIYQQKIDLLEIKSLVILNNYKKARRKLNRIDPVEVASVNESLYAFLNYTVFKLMNDQMNADIWLSKISSLNLKKAELILKNNGNGSVN